MEIYYSPTFGDELRGGGGGICTLVKIPQKGDETLTVMKLTPIDLKLHKFKMLWISG